MAKRAKGRTPKRKRAVRKRGRTAGAPARKADVAAAASRRFVDDLLVRGEAAERKPDGTLPLDATHVITKRRRDGTVQVERVRFKTF